MMTAVPASAGSCSSRLSSVVLPAPRKPVSTVSGIGAAGPARGLRRRRSLLGGLSAGLAGVFGLGGGLGRRRRSSASSAWRLSWRLRRASSAWRPSARRSSAAVVLASGARRGVASSTGVGVDCAPSVGAAAALGRRGRLRLAGLLALGGLGRLRPCVLARGSRRRRVDRRTRRAGVDADRHRRPRVGPAAARRWRAGRAGSTANTA